MPELSLGPPPERSRLPAILIAVVVLAIVAWLLVRFTPHQTAELSVQKVDLIAPHTVFKQMPGSVHVLGTPAATEDDLYVLVTLRITDKLRLPIFLAGHSATMTAADGSSMDATLVDPSQFHRLGEILPQLAPLLTQVQTAGHAWNDDDEIAPGTPLTGSVLLLFPQISEAQWRAKKSASLTFNLRHQLPQTVTLP